MASIIDAAVTARRRRWRRTGALDLSDRAANACLERARHRATELDLLINAGIYKDHGTAEPALASIIQEDIGANPGSPPKLGRSGTFSFDLVDGACGVLQAAQIADGFVGHGSARLAMIVAADAAPAVTRGFPFPPVGGAVVLSHAEGERGFSDFRMRTFPEDAGLFESRLRWDPTIGPLGRNVVEIIEAPEYGDRLLARAVEVVRPLIEGLQIDLLIASQYPADFPVRLARQLGIPPRFVPPVGAALAGSHTAGWIAALESAIDRGMLARATRALFVTAGAGTTVVASLYRN